MRALLVPCGGTVFDEAKIVFFEGLLRAVNDFEIANLSLNTP